jgi:hypothetical protein
VALQFFIFIFSSYYIQHYFICRPSDSTVPTDAGIEPRTVATGALAVRRSNHYVDLIRGLTVNTSTSDGFMQHMAFLIVFYTS